MAESQRGEVLYIRYRSWQEATSYELSVKKTEKKLDTTNYEHAKAVRSTTKVSQDVNFVCDFYKIYILTFFF